MLSRRARYIFLLATANLVACSHSAIAPETAEPQVPAEWSRGGNEGDVAVNWLNAFEQPQLRSLVAEAQGANYALAQERARLTVAEQAVIITRSGRLPVFDVSLDGSRIESEDPGGGSTAVDSFGTSLDGRWDADIWGELSSAQRAAELDLAAQRARLESVERDLAGSVAGAVFDAMEARQLLGVARRRLDNAIESHEIVASGYRQGLNDALDLYLARNQVERERASFAQQEQSLLETVSALELSLARYPDGAMNIEGELPILNEPIPAGLPADLLTRRTDLQEAWLSLLAADADLAVAHKARFPSLSLVGSAGLSSGELSDLLDAGSASWLLRSALSQTLWNGGRLRALEAQAKAQVEQTEQVYLDLVYRAFAEVENAISRTASLRTRYDAFLEAEKNSRAALELALEQYQRGLVSYTTVLESQRQAFDAESTVVQLRNQQLQNRISLYLALGGEFATD